MVYVAPPKLPKFDPLELIAAAFKLAKAAFRPLVAVQFKQSTAVMLLPFLVTFNCTTPNR